MIAPSPEGPVRILAIVGATASGKSSLAQEVAAQTGATLVSVDSRKVYRGLDIGTAKPSREIQERFDYAMIDCADPTETFSAGRFTEEARAVVRQRLAAGGRVILAGGTGFYLEAFRNGLADLPEVDPEIRGAIQAEALSTGWPALHERLGRIDSEFAGGVAPNDQTRILRGLEIYEQTGTPLSDLLRSRRPEPFDQPMRAVYVTRDRDDLYRRIAERVDRMVAAGLFDEVSGLLESGIPSTAPGMQSVGYPESAAYLAGDVSKDEAIAQIIRSTRRYAKRQITWYRHRPYLEAIDMQVAAEQLLTVF